MVSLESRLLNTAVDALVRLKKTTICLFCFFVVAVYGTSAFADEKHMVIQIKSISTKIEDVRRDSYDGMTKISSSRGAYFTQAGFVFKMNNQEGFILLKEIGCLETTLLENVGANVTLLLLDGVDGLVVGVLPHTGDGCIETILTAK